MKTTDANILKKDTDELIEFDKGITNLLATYLAALLNEQFDEDSLFSVWTIIGLQSDIQNEIGKRINASSSHYTER